MNQATYDVSVERDVEARMRDGTILRADIWRPRGGGPFPVLLQRLPYEKEFALADSYSHPRWYASQGYIVVQQDCRGRYRSDGVWDPFVHEVEDGADTVAWGRSLPGATGRVGMYGASYPGATQLQAAIGSGEDFGCICPAITNDGFYDGWIYEGGALHLAFASYWAMTLVSDTARRTGRLDLVKAISDAMASPGIHYATWPLNDFAPLRASGLAPYFFDWLRHQTFDDYWRARAIFPHYGQIRVPGLHIGGWYDIFLGGTLRNYAGIGATGGEGARGRQRLLIAPWFHYPWSRQTGERDFGAAAAKAVVDDEQLRFYNWTLKGIDDGISSEPPVKLFVMGENRWRTEEEWPLRRAVATDWFLHSAGRANTYSGDGWLSEAPPATHEPCDAYVHMARGPLPSRGGHSCCWESFTPMGPYDQRPVERWAGTLCYTSEPLTEAIEVTGPVSVTLHAATDQVDTDWVARLVDVHPDGTAFNLTEGIRRASSREGLDRRVLLERDRVYEYRIDLRATSNVFLPGHRLRVDVASSSFPHWDPNPGTGQPLGEATWADLRTATQTVFHDAARPSHITLPVVPRA
jgi:hypothetical protein